MKKIVKSFSAAVLAVVMMMMMVACGGTDISGTYALSSMTSEDITLTNSDLAEYGLTYTMILNSDGTGKIVMATENDSEESTLNWSKNGDLLIDGEGAAWTLQDDGKLKIYDDTDTVMYFVAK